MRLRAGSTFSDCESSGWRNDRAEGGLLDAEAVKASWARQIVEARTALLAVPSRLRQRRPSVSDEDLRVLDALIREALEGLASGGSAVLGAVTPEGST